MSACAKARDIIAKHLTPHLGQPDTDTADAIIDDLRRAGYYLDELEQILKLVDQLLSTKEGK